MTASALPSDHAARIGVKEFGSHLGACPLVVPKGELTIGGRVSPPGTPELLGSRVIFLSLELSFNLFLDSVTVSNSSHPSVF